MKVRADITYGNNAPYDPDDWRASAHPWTVTLRYGRRRMTLPYWTGAALGEPTCADVLESVAMEASSVDNARDFEDWARDFGYDSDSRKAEKLYRECQKFRDKLRRLLGSDYDAIVFPEDPDNFRAFCADQED